MGDVHRITDNGDVRVQYKSHLRDATGGRRPKFTFHPAALELMNGKYGWCWYFAEKVNGIKTYDVEEVSFLTISKIFCRD